MRCEDLVLRHAAACCFRGILRVGRRSLGDVLLKIAPERRPRVFVVFVGDRQADGSEGAEESFLHLVGLWIETYDLHFEVFENLENVLPHTFLLSCSSAELIGRRGATT